MIFLYIFFLILYLKLFVFIIIYYNRYEKKSQIRVPTEDKNLT